MLGFSFPQNPNPQFLLQSTLTPPSSSSLHHLISSSSLASAVSLIHLRTVRFSAPFPFTCAAFRNTGTTGDYQSRPVIRWKDIYNKVWLLENSETGVSGVLNQCEIDGKTFVKHELFMFIRNLRKFRRYKYALEEEARLEQAHAHQATAILPTPLAPPSANAATRQSSRSPLYSQRQHSPSPSANQGSSSSGSRGSDNRRRRLQCQLCGRPGHEAIDCWQRGNQTDFPSRRPNPRDQPRQAHTASFTSPSTIDPHWYFDSGATDHVSPDVGKLSISDTYDGSDKLQVGNGQDATPRAR